MRERRRQHEAGDAVHEEERDQHADADGDARADDAFPKLVEMLQKPHLAFPRVVIRVAGLALMWELCCHN